MANLCKIFGIGDENPLVLSVAHPTKERLNRLTRQPKFRHGGVVVALLVSCGLGVTGVAKQSVLSLHENAPIFTSDSGVAIQGVPFVVSYIDPESMKSVVEYDIRGRYLLGPKLSREYTNADLKERSSAFPNMPFLNDCIDHVYDQSVVPHWYEGQGKIFKSDAESKTYIVACLPGTRKQQADLTRADYLTSLGNAKKLSAQNASNLNYIFASSNAPLLFWRSTQTLTEDEMAALIADDPNIPESDKAAILNGVKAKAGDTIVTVESRSVYMIDPSLSEAEKIAIQEDMKNRTFVSRAVKFDGEMSEKERQERIDEMHAETERDARARGLIRVEESDEIYDFLTEE